MSASSPYRIAIIGAGPLGLATALTLHRHGQSVRIYDARPAATVIDDSRILAVSQGSRELLEQLGAWPDAQVTRIDRIQVSRQGRFNFTQMRAAELRLPALGYVLSARCLADALRAQVEAAQIPCAYSTRVVSTRAGQDAVTLTVSSGDGALRETEAKLVACCQGRTLDESASSVRDYGRHALLCRARPAQAHANLAHERLSPLGPITLLPYGDEYTVEWTVRGSEVEALLNAPDADWLAALNAALAPHVKLESLHARAHFALGQRERRKTVGPRYAWLGNAAQPLHPVAGQSFNLALRDAWELAATLHGAPDPGAAALLKIYAHRRHLDHAGAAGFTKLLARGFSNEQPIIAGLSGLGLLALEVLPPLRHFVAKRMIFGART